MLRRSAKIALVRNKNKMRLRLFESFGERLYATHGFECLVCLLSNIEFHNLSARIAAERRDLRPVLITLRQSSDGLTFSTYRKTLSGALASNVQTTAAFGESWR